MCRISLYMRTTVVYRRVKTDALGNKEYSNTDAMKYAFKQGYRPTASELVGPARGRYIEQ